MRAFFVYFKFSSAADGLIASKLAPTVSVSNTKTVNTTEPVGASLLRAAFRR